jgi:hypothetical protein
MPNYYPDPNRNPYRVSREPVREPVVERRTSSIVDFDTQRICPSCGKIIKISHNFCKFCGVDLNYIPALGESDRTLKELSIAALTDQDFEVRKDAIASLAELGEKEILGVLTYALMNDLHELVRKEAAEKLGNIHDNISLDVLARALKDKSPIVRKAAIEALKEIKKFNKPVKQPKVGGAPEIEPKSQEDKKQDLDEDSDEDEPPTLKEIEPNDDDAYKY